MNKSVSNFMFYLTIFYLLFLNNMMSIWLLMELNMFCFIMFLVSSVSFNVEVIMIVFILQIFSSFLMIVFILFNLDYKDLFFVFGLIIKSALFPVMHWYFMLLYLGGGGVFLMLTLQKLFLFFLIGTFFLEKLFMCFLFFTLIVVFLNLSQTLMKLLIIFSSLFHSLWTMLSFMLSSFLFFFYFLVYTFVLFLTIFYFLRKSNNFLFLLSNFQMMLIVLSVSGLPPFIMFLPKLYIIYFLQVFTIVVLVLMFFTFVNLTVYLRMLSILFMSGSKMMKILYYNYYPSFFLFFFNTVFLITF